jgi:hypothetical protein
MTVPLGASIFILDGHHAVERKGTSFFGGATMSLDRPRPPKPDQAAAPKSEQS